MIFKPFFGVTCTCFAILSFNANALLIDNESYTTDTDSRLDWLDLSATINMSYTEALLSNTGWRYANNSEIENLFSISFSSYTTTNTYNNAIVLGGTLLSTQADKFYTLFGGYDGTSYGISYGLYSDEDNIIRMMGTDISKYSGKAYVFSDEFIPEYSASFSNVYFGTYLVRDFDVPEPPVLWLVGSGLLCFIAFAGRKA